MMKQTGYIEHEGIVTQVAGNKVSVNLINTSSCSNCHVKGFCNVSDIDNKKVEITNPTDKRIKKGDEVIVHYEQLLGPLALVLGYIIPFVIVLFTLILALSITDNEATSGLLSLFILIPYYSILYLFRNNLKTRFTFNIKSIKNQAV
jgi:sigma-E factor negative regulatory protein RseC